MCYFQQALDVKLKEDPPEDGRPPAEVMGWVAREVLPFATRLDHPRCFAFIPSAPTWPGMLADFMAAGYNFNQSTWLVASGPSAIELVVIDWLKGWIGYPEGAGGLLTSGGSAASVDAFVAAREAAGNPEGATVYMSDQSHSAQVRAARITGVKQEHMRLLPVDERFRLDVETLARAVAEDRAAGLHPVTVCANAGASSTGAIDPLEAIADFCEAEGIWLHVDGLRHGDGEGQGTLARHRARRFGEPGWPQVVLPALRGGRPAGKGRLHARKGVRGAPRCPPGHHFGAPTTRTSRTAGCN